MGKMKKWKRQKPGEQEFKLIPPGKYPAVITKVEIKENKSGTGEYLQVEFTLSKKHKGRKLWNIFNLWNDNVTACKISAREFANLEVAVGRRIVDTKDLNGKKLLLGVKTQPETTNKKGETVYKAKSVPSGYWSLKKGKSSKKGDSKTPWPK